MTAKPHRLGAGSAAGNYYTNDAAREAKPSRRDEYYLSEGGGVWWSSGETVVRHNASIDRASFHDLCAGRDPRTGEPLVRGAGPDHWAGLDLTLTPGKSVSVLWAAGDETQRAAIEAAHRAAVERTLRFVLNENLVEVRTGAGGKERHPPSDLIVARFDHYTTRAGDPNLHTHCVLLNVAGAPPGAGAVRYRFRHLTIDPQRIFDYQLVIGAAYRAALAEGLVARFPFAYREAGTGQWEIAGVPEPVLDAFSKRSAAIEAYAGPDASAAQREIAALATRAGKDEVPTGPELEARWRAELRALDADPWHAALAPDRKRLAREGHEPAFDPPAIPGESPVARAASALFRFESVVERKALLQGALVEAGLQGLGIEAVERELMNLERSGALLVLAGGDLARCWTTPAAAATEAAMLRAAERPSERDWFEATAVEAALARARHLVDEQADAVRWVTSRDGVGLLEAGAGTGKTTTAKALVDAAQASNLRVLGLAPSWVAADELSRATGIEAVAIARWRHDLAAERVAAPDARTLLLVDEAGMVGTADMAAILTEAERAGAKVVLVGDRRQLGSVAGASALRGVAEVVERAAALRGVRRQEVDWQRAASVLMARGNTEAGLRTYATRGHVELVAGADAALERTIAIWREGRARHGDDVLIVTRRNRDAAALNERAREVLRSEGRLGPDCVALPSLDRAERRTSLRLAVGDRVRFGETLPHLRIRNGNRATLEAVEPDSGGGARLTLRLENGRVVDETWERLAREPRFGRKAGPPRIVHAYAGTVYAAQGRTSAAAVVHVAGATDARELYVGLTRHRHDVRVVVEAERLDALCRQRQADPRTQPTRTAVLERLFAEAGTYREKANVSDYMSDRAAFVRSGAVEKRAPEPVLAVTRAARAAGRLREALVELGLAPLTVPLWRLVHARIRRLPLAMQESLFAIRARVLGNGERATNQDRGGPER